jgi:hypothetical protein
MKKFNILLAAAVAAGSLSGCSEDLLDVKNNNNQTTEAFSQSTDGLSEAVIAAYNHIRMEGTYGRVGYTFDVCRGDEAWNSSQQWYLPFDELNTAITNEMNNWVFRDWFYTINASTYVITKIPNKGVSTAFDRLRGQALFIHALAYYNIMGYYKDAPIVTDYDKDYNTIDGLYWDMNSQEKIIELIKKELTEAIELLPKRDEGGEWAGGRATQGAAAALLGKVLMFNHEFKEAQKYLEGIINGEYGTYSLVKNYGDNFQEGSQFENNSESIFEVQFLDHDVQGTQDEWTPVNVTPDATQGHAIESNFAAGKYGGWADISASNWLYNLFKSERTVDNKLDPRMYWTIATYEDDWTTSYPAGGNGNFYYGVKMKKGDLIVTNDGNGGIPIAKYTNARTGILSQVVTGLRCGINIRLIRLADIYLLAAEAINENEGPTAKAVEYVDKVRERANLCKLAASDKYKGATASADAFFEYLANVERPRELGCEYGRGFDLIRWGWFYDDARFKQIKDHASIQLINVAKDGNDAFDFGYPLQKVDKTSYDSYIKGHEYIPYYQGTLDANPGLGKGNSANTGTPNTPSFSIRPVVKEIGLNL